MPAESPSSRPPAEADGSRGPAGVEGRVAEGSVPATGAVATALAAAAAVGPFFAVTVTPGDSEQEDPGWIPVSELIADPSLLADRVEAARAVIAGSARQPPESVEPRVAASIVFLGLAARLISPPLATTVLVGVIPSWITTHLWVRPVAGGPWPLATDTSTGHRVVELDTPAGLQEAAHRFTATVTAVIEPVLVAFERQFQISPTILTGNAASGMAGAVGLLAAARPDRADRAYALAEALLGRGLLRDTGGFAAAPESARRRPRFVRRSCCLFYRVPGAGTCGDCILTAPGPSVRRAAGTDG